MYSCVYTHVYLCVHVELCMYVVYVTWAGGICWICMHKPEGMKFLVVSVELSGKFLPHLLHTYLM